MIIKRRNGRPMQTVRYSIEKALCRFVWDTHSDWTEILVTDEMIESFIHRVREQLDAQRPKH